MSVRQSTLAVSHDQTMRMNNKSVITSGRAGEVIPVAAFGLFRGDSATGRVSISMELAEMPAPLENAVVGRAQSWCVPRPSLPQFEGPQEYLHAYQGQDITKLNSATRTPPSLFDTVATGAITAAENSEFFRALGISLDSGVEINTDYIDAYNLVQNFRLAAYSSKMTRYDYYAEDAVSSLELKPAFWPRNRVHQMVPDYETALVKGALELDVSAGTLPIRNLRIEATAASASGQTNPLEDDGDIGAAPNYVTNARPVFVQVDGAGNFPDVVDPPVADMAGIVVPTSLADIDMARKTNAFAKRMANMRGSNYSGFNNDDVIIAELMQGFPVDEEFFNRPWLLDSKTVVFGITERHATDAANLEDSVVTGEAGLQLSLNIPRQKYGAVVITTVEVMPERLFPRMSDEYLYMTSPNDLPDALRDSQVTEPVDVVRNRRIDTSHASPSGQYGFEPMNAKWRQEETRMGGEFRSLVPGEHATAARTQIWQPEYVDPAMNSDHWLCPHPFPQDVFSVPSNDCVNIMVQQSVTIAGITQFGDDLMEDNADFVDVSTET